MPTPSRTTNSRIRSWPPIGKGFSRSIRCHGPRGQTEQRLETPAQSDGATRLIHRRERGVLEGMLDLEVQTEGRRHLVRNASVDLHTDVLVRESLDAAGQVARLPRRADHAQAAAH